MNDIEKLLAIESIKQTKARYFRGIDTKDWEAYASAFAPDAEMDMREQSRNPNHLISGSAKIARFVAELLEGVITAHQGHTPEIELTSDTTANVIWAMEDNLWKVDASVRKPFTHMNGWGHYRETYRNVDGQWLIQTTTLTRLRVDIVP